MIESIPVASALRVGWWGLKSLRQRLWPKKPFEIVAVLRDHVDYGHDVMLVNTSDQPVHINNFDIVDAAKEGDEDNKCDCVFNLEDELQDIRLAPQEGRKFFFNEAYYFPWKPKNGNYYFRVWITGRKDPVWVKF